MSNETSPRILTLDEILSAPDIIERVIEVPQWGGSVKVRSFTKAQQQDIREAAKVDDEIDSSRLEVLMLIGGIVDPVITQESYELLRQKAAGPIDLILGVLLEISGLTAEAVDAARKAFRN